MSELPLGAIERRTPFKGPRFIERALAVINFAPIPKIGDAKNQIVNNFQDAIRQGYPRFEERLEQSIKIDVSEKGQVATAPNEQRSWVFRSEDKGKKVVLTTQLLAFEVSRDSYTNWDNYVRDLLKLVEAFEKYAEPSHVARVGLRYLNTASINGDEDPRSICNDALTSITGHEQLEAADLAWVFEVDEGTLLLRSGIMPAGATYEPFYQSRDEKTWYLDIDVANDSFEPFKNDAIEVKLRAQATRAHAVYAWAMSKKEAR